jgi:hypothetical protein
MAAYVSNIVIDVGSDFSQIYTLESSNDNSILDLNGCVINSQMRKHSASSKWIDFDAVIIDVPLGKIGIGLTNSVTTNIKPGRYIFDIVITKNSFTQKVVEGMALVREGATK